MAEEKEVKKTTTKKDSTAKGSIDKKRVETKAKTKSKELTLADIPPELMKQMFELFQQNQPKQEAVVEEIKEEVPEKITKAYLRKIKDKEIIVRSVAGTVNFKSPKTNILYKWIEVGDEEVLTIDEILTMESTSRRFLNTPWLMIDDKEVIEGLGLTDLYKSIKDVQDCDALLEKDIDEIERAIKKAPYECRKSLAGTLFQKVINEELRDLVKIRKLEDVLGTALLI